MSSETFSPGSGGAFEWRIGGRSDEGLLSNGGPPTRILWGNEIGVGAVEARIGVDCSEQGFCRSHLWGDLAAKGLDSESFGTEGSSLEYSK